MSKEPLVQGCAQWNHRRFATGFAVGNGPCVPRGEANQTARRRWGDQKRATGTAAKHRSAKKVTSTALRSSSRGPPAPSSGARTRGNSKDRLSSDQVPSTISSEDKTDPWDGTLRPNRQPHLRLPPHSMYTSNHRRVPKSTDSVARTTNDQHLAFEDSDNLLAHS